MMVEIEQLEGGAGPGPEEAARLAEEAAAQELKDLGEQPDHGHGGGG
jgi:hypothetical protein